MHTSRHDEGVSLIRFRGSERWARNVRKGMEPDVKGVKRNVLEEELPRVEATTHAVTPLFGDVQKQEVNQRRSDPRF